MRTEEHIVEPIEVGLDIVLRYTLTEIPEQRGDYDTEPLSKRVEVSRLRIIIEDMGDGGEIELYIPEKQRAMIGRAIEIKLNEELD
jgi:hypothetical protein